MHLYTAHTHYTYILHTHTYMHIARLITHHYTLTELYIIIYIIIDWLIDRSLFICNTSSTHTLYTYDVSAESAATGCQ